MTLIDCLVSDLTADVRVEGQEDIQLEVEAGHCLLREAEEVFICHIQLAEAEVEAEADHFII